VSTFVRQERQEVAHTLIAFTIDMWLAVIGSLHATVLLDLVGG